MCIVYSLNMEHSAVKTNMKYQNKHPPQSNYARVKEHISKTSQKNNLQNKQKAAKSYNFPV